jgi:riboflavin synthase
MFTGLIEATGSVRSLETRGDQARLTLELPFAGELALGDSVAVNGCCLTVASREAQSASFDLLAQTLRVTSLGALRAGSLVNLERAMTAGGRFGGHFVQGHVDATGTITRLDPDGQDHILEVQLPPSIHALCIDKGSIAIDGISLTIASLGESSATFWITPHTHAHTHLHQSQPGQIVNLEADVIAKYVEKLLVSRLPAR